MTKSPTYPRALCCAVVFLSCLLTMNGWASGAKQKGPDRLKLFAQPASAAKLAVTLRPNTPIRPGFNTLSIPPNDDGSSSIQPLGFTVNFFGLNFSSLYVNNNGNITFDQPLPAYSPFNLTNTNTEILAPYFADVDTTGIGSGVTQYGPGTADGHKAFGATWLGVGYFSSNTDKLNSFQVVIIDRSDIAPHDFDFEFNYDKIQWETGDASGGYNGLGGTSARVGYSNGTGAPNTSFELPGSAIPGSFLDANAITGLISNDLNSTIPGRYVFQVRSGVVQKADLTLTKSAAPTAVNVGGNVTYTLTVTNNGPAVATNVKVVDTLPAGVAFDSVTVSQGAYSGTSTVTWAIDHLDAGTNATASIVLTANTAGTLTNTAVASSDIPDPNQADNTATAVVTVSNLSTVQTPTFLPAPGTYTNAVNVAISCATPGAVIYYTTDNTYPTASSVVYTTPIPIATTSTLKAIALKTGWINSAINSGVYTIAPLAATPVFTPAPGAYTGSVSVSISCATPGAVIYYTLDGSVPTLQSSVYSSPIPLTSDTTVKAFAVAAGLTNSLVAAGAYTVAVAAPVLTPAPGTYPGTVTVAISCPTPGAVIRYTTDGTVPTSTSPGYTTPLTFTVNTTLKAYGAQTGKEDSTLTVGDYAIQVATPTFTPDSAISYSNTVTVTLACATIGAAIHYTTDGTSPTVNSPLFSSPLTLTQTTTINALALAPGMVASAVATATYTVIQTVATPVLTPLPGAYLGSVSVSVACATPGAAILYQLNGGSWQTLVGALAITATTVLEVKGTKVGMADSALTGGSYTITVPPVSFNPAPGTYLGSVAVAMTCPITDATIYYTTSGTDPTTKSLLYTAPVLCAQTTTLKAKAVKPGLVDSDITPGAYVVQVQQPVVTPGTGAYQGAKTITIACATPGAVIYYTLNGLTPTSHSTIYTAPILLTRTATIQALALKSGMLDSAVDQETVTILASAVATPVFKQTKGSANTCIVAIACATNGASIHYTTNGADPTLSSPLYTAPLVFAATTTLTARGFKALLATSSQAVATFQIIGDVYEPDDNPAQAKIITNGNAQRHSIDPIGDVDWVKFSLTEKSDVLVKTSGPSGDTEMWLYGPDTSVTQIAYNDDAGPSTKFSQIQCELAPGTYYVKVRSYANLAKILSYTLTLLTTGVNQVATPTFSPDAGSYNGSVRVAIQSDTSGAEIHYTTDGSVPTLLSPKYTAPLMLTATTTLKAQAFKAGMLNNATAVAVFSVTPVKFKVAAAAPEELARFVGQPITYQIGAQPGANMQYMYILCRQESNGTWSEVSKSDLLPASCYCFVPQVPGHYLLTAITLDASGKSTAVDISYNVVESK